MRYAVFALQVQILIAMTNTETVAMLSGHLGIKQSVQIERARGLR